MRYYIAKFLCFFIDDIKNKFPNLFHHAVNALKKRAVKKYIFPQRLSPIYIVVGESKDYLVEINFGEKLTYSCSCLDFQFNITTRPFKGGGERSLCYHVLAVMISLISELAYHIGNEFDSFRRRELLPEILMEDGYIDIVLHSI